MKMNVIIIVRTIDILLDHPRKTQSMDREEATKATEDIDTSQQQVMSHRIAVVKRRITAAKKRIAVVALISLRRAIDLIDHIDIKIKLSLIFIYFFFM